MLSAFLNRNCQKHQAKLPLAIHWVCQSRQVADGDGKKLLTALIVWKWACKHLQEECFKAQSGNNNTNIVASSWSGKQEQNMFVLRRDLKGGEHTKGLPSSAGKPWGGSPTGDIGGGNRQGQKSCFPSLWRPYSWHDWQLSFSPCLLCSLSLRRPHWHWKEQNV